MKSRRISRLVANAAQSRFIYGSLLSGIAIFLTILFAPEGTVPLRAFLLTLVIALILIAMIGNVCWQLYRGQSPLLPALITVETLPVPGDSSATVLVLESSELFSHGILVAVYQYAHSFERLIGVGYVLTVQTRDQKIQVVITSFVEPKESETWQALLQKNANMMKEIIVKPYLPKAYLPER
jgi:hypothetical protein